MRHLFHSPFQKKMVFRFDAKVKTTTFPHSMWRSSSRTMTEWRECLREWSAHGVRYVADFRYGRWERLLWLLLVACSFGGLLSFGLSTFQQSENNPMVTTQETVPIQVRSKGFAFSRHSYKMVLEYVVFPLLKQKKHFFLLIFRRSHCRRSPSRTWPPKASRGRSRLDTCRTRPSACWSSTAPTSRTSTGAGTGAWRSGAPLATFWISSSPQTLKRQFHRTAPRPSTPSWALRRARPGRSSPRILTGRSWGRKWLGCSKRRGRTRRLKHSRDSQRSIEYFRTLL